MRICYINVVFFLPSAWIFFRNISLNFCLSFIAFNSFFFSSLVMFAVPEIKFGNKWNNTIHLQCNKWVNLLKYFCSESKILKAVYSGLFTLKMTADRSNCWFTPWKRFLYWYTNLLNSAILLQTLDLFFYHFSLS